MCVSGFFCYFEALAGLMFHITAWIQTGDQIKMERTENMNAFQFRAIPTRPSFKVGFDAVLRFHADLSAGGREGR